MQLVQSRQDIRAFAFHLMSEYNKEFDLSLSLCGFLLWFSVSLKACLSGNSKHLKESKEHHNWGERSTQAASLREERGSSATKTWGLKLTLVCRPLQGRDCTAAQICCSQLSFLSRYNATISVDIRLNWLHLNDLLRLWNVGNWKQTPPPSFHVDISGVKLHFGNCFLQEMWPHWLVWRYLLKLN